MCTKSIIYQRVISLKLYKKIILHSDLNSTGRHYTRQFLFEFWGGASELTATVNKYEVETIFHVQLGKNQ